MQYEDSTDDFPEPGEEMGIWATKLDSWFLGGFRMLKPNVPDNVLRRDVKRALEKAKGSPSKEAEIMDELAALFAAVGYLEPMPVVPQWVRKASRDAHLAWFWEGYGKLHPTMSDYELFTSMADAVRRDGGYETIVKIEREFKRIGYRAGPSLK